MRKESVLRGESVKLPGNGVSSIFCLQIMQAIYTMYNKSHHKCQHLTLGEKEDDHTVHRAALQARLSSKGVHSSLR